MDEARRLLPIEGIDVEQVPNGVDVELFRPVERDRAERRALWHRWLVDDAQGWSEHDQEPGALRYEDAALDVLVDEPVLLYVGRFLGFKRVPLLVRAYDRARREHGIRAPLVVWGGAPGEWEGEHPHTVAEQLGVEGVYFVGWRGHDELPLGLTCADVFVAPSTDEPFGQVYLEAMACGVPVIGTLSGGPPSFVNVHPDEPDGWLVTPDDEGQLADAIAEAVADDERRRRRGGHALAHVRADYSWQGLAGRFAGAYEAVR
jgi:D-inositol-3-phosphate glycosyltransferase